MFWRSSSNTKTRTFYSYHSSMGKGCQYRPGHNKAKQDKNYDKIDWAKGKPSKLSFKVNIKGAK